MNAIDDDYCQMLMADSAGGWSTEQLHNHYVQFCQEHNIPQNLYGYFRPEFFGDAANGDPEANLFELEDGLNEFIEANLLAPAIVNGIATYIFDDQTINYVAEVDFSWSSNDAHVIFYSDRESFLEDINH